MRILVCNWKDQAHPHAGGAELYTNEVTRRWASAGHDVTLFAAAVPGEAAEEHADGVRIVRRGARTSVYAEARRWYEQQRGRFDLVIDEVNTRPFGCASWPGSARVVALVHQVAREIWRLELPPPAAWLGRYVLEPRWLRSLRDVPVLTVSPSSAESLRSYGVETVRVLPQGCSLPTRRPPLGKEPDPTFLFVGRLAPVKQPDHALEAFRRIRRHLRRARLWVIGGGPLSGRLRAMAPPGVHFLGRVDDEEKFRRMASAHALLVTSVREGWGLVVSEAASVGTRAVAYARPGLVDSVRAARGILVPPHPAALAEASIDAWPALRHDGEPLPTGTASWDEVAARFLEASLEPAMSSIRHG